MTEQEMILSKICVKVRYPSRIQAQRAISQMKSTGKLRRGESMSAYECPTCGEGVYHYGHDRGSK
jgi:hypothetical protein